MTFTRSTTSVTFSIRHHFLRRREEKKRGGLIHPDFLRLVLFPCSPPPPFLALGVGGWSFLVLAALSLSTKILGRRWRGFLFSFFIQNSLDRVRESSLRVDMIKGERGSDSKVSLYHGSGTTQSIRLTIVENPFCFRFGSRDSLQCPPKNIAGLEYVASSLPSPSLYPQ